MRTIEEIKDSEEYKESLRRAMEFRNSETRKNYSNQRIKNHVGNYKASMAGGIKKIRERGSVTIHLMNEYVEGKKLGWSFFI